MRQPHLPELRVPDTLAREDMPDLLRHWYLGPRARRHMMLRRFAEVDAELPSTGAVLDIGSAWGFNVMALGMLGYETAAVDLVADQFAAGQEIARANGVRFAAAGADAAALPFVSAAFDAITMVETFEHIYLEDRGAALAECLRVLRPGGCLVLSTPNFGGAVERIKRLTGAQPWIRRRLPSMCYPDEGTDRADYHPYRYHRPLPDRGVVALLEEVGFSVVRVKHFLFVLKNTPNRLFALARLIEAGGERVPLLRRLAATSCFVAVKPDRPAR